MDDASREVTEGEGGGIVHAVVQLGVTDEELADATRELRRARSGAEVAGPVIFRSGSFGLVTSFTAENGELTTRVVGLGTAPVLDGGKAAISIQLTKLGAKILHQSFQTATPDISFMFEMQMAGYREPVRADDRGRPRPRVPARELPARRGPHLRAGRDTQAIDDLCEKKVIRLEQVGEDEKLEGRAGRVLEARST